MMTPEQFNSYQEYLKSMSRKELIDHALLQMEAVYFVQQENEQLKLQSSRSNAQYLSCCRSVGGVTLPPGV